MLSLLVFFQIQLNRILSTPTPHASGPKRPDLSQQDAGKEK